MAVEVKATVITELSTLITMMGADLIDAAKPAPEFSGMSTPDQRPPGKARTPGPANPPPEPHDHKPGSAPSRR